MSERGSVVEVSSCMTCQVKVAKMDLDGSGKRWWHERVGPRTTDYEHYLYCRVNVAEPSRGSI